MHIFLRITCSGGFQISAAHEEAMRSFPGGELSHELPPGLSCVWPLWLPAQSHPALVPWPLPGLHDPTPELNSQIKLGQLTPLLRVFLPLPQGSLLFFCYGWWQFLVSMVYQQFPLPTDLFLWLQVWHSWKLEGKPQVNGLALTYPSSPTTDRYSYWIWLTAIKQPNCRHVERYQLEKAWGKMWAKNKTVFYF